MSTLLDHLISINKLSGVHPNDGQESIAYVECVVVILYY
jgi:hypothetical protein